MADMGESQSISKKDDQVKKYKDKTIFDHFTPSEIREFKAGFDFIDSDGDGLLSYADLKKTFSEIGQIADESIVKGMIKESPTPINFTTFLTMIFERTKFLEELEQWGQEIDDEAMANAICQFQLQNDTRKKVD